MFPTAQTELFVVPSFGNLHLNSYEVFIKLLGGRFVGSAKINFDIGRQLWCTVSPFVWMYGKTVITKRVN